MKGGLDAVNRNRLKILAALTMLLDHIALAFLPEVSAAYQLLRMIGRLAGPTMAFFLAEGCVHTRDARRYALRLGLFALLSWPAFSLFLHGTWPTASFGVIYTLLLGFAAIQVWEHSDWSRGMRILSVFALCCLSFFGDWAVFDVLLPLFFFVFRGDERKKWTAYLLTAVPLAGIPLLIDGTASLYMVGVFAVPLLLRLYNGENGHQSPFSKWFFYVFYPAHLLLLWWLKLLVTGSSG